MASKKAPPISAGKLASVPILVLVIVTLAWLVFGGPVYTIEAQEVGVVLTLGKYSKTVEPGLHFRIPWPIQTVERVQTAKVNRLEIGFRSVSYGGETDYVDFTDPNYSDLHSESQMLTGDENVVNCSMAVQYRITEPLAFLFTFQDPSDAERALKDMAEAALRQAVGDHPVDAALTEGKSIIRAEIQEKIQELVAAYGMGVTITEVQLQDVKPPEEVRSAFQAVASAREQREQFINVARAYQSEQIPKAEGESQSLMYEAEGYRESQIAKARGEVARFQALTKEYNTSPDLIRTRMYLEMLSTTLPNLRITVVDEKANLLNVKSLQSVLNYDAGALQTAGESQE